MTQSQTTPGTGPAPAATGPRPGPAAVQPRTAAPAQASTSDLAGRLMRRWIFVGPLGIAVSVCLIVTGAFGPRVSKIETVVAIACGWAVMLALSPWRRFRELREQETVIAQLTDRLIRAIHGKRQEPLSKIIVDRDDAIGQLSRVIHDSLAQGIAHRAEARMLWRTMDESIRRETVRATADLQRQATTDPLTGLGNRRLLEQRLTDLVVTHHGSISPIAVMAIDLNRFKQINDTLGHDIGDQCLIFMGDLLKSGLRREDSAARVGGDEFVVVMPGHTQEQAQAVADRLKALFAQMPWPYQSVRAPSLSIGVVATRPGKPIKPDELVRRADELMYAAKRADRAA